MRHLMVQIDKAALRGKSLPGHDTGSHSLSEAVQAVHEVIWKGLERRHARSQQHTRGPESQVPGKKPTGFGVVGNVIDAFKAHTCSFETVLYGARRQTAGITDPYVSDPRKFFLFDSGDDQAITNQRGGCVAVLAGDSENYHLPTRPSGCSCIQCTAHANL